MFPFLIIIEISNLKIFLIIKTLKGMRITIAFLSDNNIDASLNDAHQLKYVLLLMVCEKDMFILIEHLFEE